MTEEFIQSNCIHCERYGEILETGTRLCNVYQDDGGGMDEELNKMHQCPLQEVKLQFPYIQEKPILDVCCGSRMFYFDKQDDRVLFCDIRELETTLCDGRPLVVKPDILADFRHLPFEDGRTVKKAPLLHKEKYTDEQLNLCEKFYYNMVSNKQNADNWQKSYNEAKAQLKAELEAKGQEMTYDGMKFRMEQSEFWKDHYEKECVRYEREMRYNVTERRLLIQEIRKYDPTFKVDGIEQEVMKIHGIK